MSQLLGKILVVDDEKHVRLFLTHLLRREGHEVLEATSGEEAVQLISPAVDLALLDLNLGKGIDGVAVLHEIRRVAPETVIIMLTGNGTLDSAISALQQGAHDYLLKPCPADNIRQSVQKGLQKRHTLKQQEQLFSQLEQNLTLLNALREPRIPSYQAEERPVASPPAVMIAPPAVKPAPPAYGLHIDPLRHLAFVNEQPLDLSPLEFELLSYLVKAAPRVVPATELVTALHGYDTSPNEARDVIRTNIYRLRQKITAVDPQANPDLIRTVRGVGYTINGA